MSELIKVHADAICTPPGTGPAVVTVGTYDGVHRGHQEILKRMNAAAQNGEVRTVVTFEPHPQSVLRRNGYAVPVLCDTQEKIRLLCDCGISRTYILKFNQKLARLSAEAFVQEILLERLQTTRLVVGYNHSFGHNREGNAEFLEKNKRRFGFEVEVVGPFYIEGEIVSSSKIRRALSDGDAEKARLYLGRPYVLSGIVIAGAARGRQMEVPTANIAVTSREKLIPQTGIYAVEVEVESDRHPGMLSMGTRPTFGGGDFTIEVHLINFEGDLYGQNLHIHFLRRLRDEERFGSADALKKQMSRDREDSLRIYEDYLSEKAVTP